MNHQVLKRRPKCFVKMRTLSTMRPTLGARYSQGSQRMTFWWWKYSIMRRSWRTSKICYNITYNVTTSQTMLQHHIQCYNITYNGTHNVTQAQWRSPNRRLCGEGVHSLKALVAKGVEDVKVPLRDVQGKGSGDVSSWLFMHNVMSSLSS